MKTWVPPLLRERLSERRETAQPGGFSNLVEGRPQLSFNHLPLRPQPLSFSASAFREEGGGRGRREREKGGGRGGRENLFKLTKAVL